MLVYAFGLLFIIFASSSWMLLAGYVVAGLAVGADVQDGGGFGQQSFFQLWSGELFPTLLRSTA